MSPETTTRVLAFLDLIRRVSRWRADKQTSEPEARTFGQLANQARTLAERVEAEQQPAVRVFARVQGADVECPKCGVTFSFGFVRTINPASKIAAKRRGARQWYWDPTTATLTCPQCRTPWVPALVLYRRARTWQQRRGIPADQIADDRQRAELRACAQGYWLPEKVPGFAEQTNHVQPEGCTCDPGPERAGTDSGCVVHGAGDQERR